MAFNPRSDVIFASAAEPLKNGARSALEIVDKGVDRPLIRFVNSYLPAVPSAP